MSEIPHTLAARLSRLEAGLQTLPDKPEETAHTALVALAHLAAGTRLSLQAAAEGRAPALDDSQLEALDGYIARRLTGIPLAHLTERQRFMGLEMLAGPQALIPRHETELLATAARAKLLACEAARPCVVDVCTGSGNLALALAHAAPAARVFASDLSADAVELAGRNAQLLGLQARVAWRVGDLLAPFDEPAFHGQVDLLTCNPPYISSKKLETMPGEIVGHEPHLAFDGGPLGVRILTRVVREAPRFLKPGGWLAVEIGLGQGKAMRQRLEAAGSYARVEEVLDAQGEIRALLGRT